MKSTFRHTLAVFVFALLCLPSAFASSISAVEAIATTMMSDLGQSAIRLEVMPVRDAKSDDRVRALMNAASMQFKAGSVATALYYKGQCTVIVDTNATNEQLRPDLQRLASKDDVVFFVTTHEVAHCISQHRQAQELHQLAAGNELSNTFLPPAVLEQGAKGTLNSQSFTAIMRSLETVKREEVFADVLAGLYVRLKKDNAPGILAAIIKTRVEGTEQGDEAHDTAAKLTAASAYVPAFSLSEVVELGHRLRN